MSSRTLRPAPIGCCLAVLLSLSSVSSAQWAQWGGPNRDFTVQTTGLANEWPDEGPRQIWKRPLGDGYSSILADNGVLYTMYRIKEDEFTIALSAADGKTIWEHKNLSPFTPTMAEFGPGPHATPLIIDSRLYSVGTNAVLHCFDKSDGKILWKHDLIKDFNGGLRPRGYSCSPIAYKNTIVLPLGNEKDGPGAVALDQKTGQLKWKSAHLRATHASPILIRFDGEDQLVLFMAAELVGLNPDTGKVLWSAKHGNNALVNASTPLWNGKDTLFCANAYDGGARAFRLTREGGKTVPKQLWYSTRMKLHHGNALLIGDKVFASSGMGTAFYVGMELETGKQLFRQRGFAKSTTLYADGKLILLDENGLLGLATIEADGLNIHSQQKIADPYAWAAPTLVGTRLYVLDRQHIMAFELGSGAN
jgi:outer membrane protein assembly factor BamB